MAIGWPRLKPKMDFLSRFFSSKNEQDLNPTFSRVMESLPWRFFRKIAMMQIVVTSVVIISTAWMARYYLKTYITTQADVQLRESLNLIRASITNQNISPLEWCNNSFKLHWNTRYTIINTQGRALCDNYQKPELLDNQLQYKEVGEALRLGFGRQVRFDAVSATNLIYGAISLETKVNGLKERFIIRQTVPLNNLDKAMRELDRAILIFLLPLLIITSLASLWGSLQVSFPLRSILRKVDQMKRVTSQESTNYKGDPNDEWSLVEKTLDRAQEGLENYIEQLYNENEKMGTVMESITDSILAIGLNEEILFANYQFKKNFLAKDVKRKEINHFKIWEVTRDLELQSLFNDCLITAEPVKRRNMELQIKGGKRNSYFDIKVNPLFDQKGEIFGAVGVFHDVTERKLAEQMREDFVANVSHEIRTPLTAIKGFAQIIRDTPPEKQESVRPFLLKLENNADRLTNLFNDILDLSVIESKHKVNKETLNPIDLTETVLINVKQSYPQKGIQYKLESSISQVWGNPMFIEQVVTNLVENAFKYTSQGGTVTVEWHKSESEKWDILKVSDNGIGIPKNHHERLFERFYRVDSGRSRDAGGTGLGLAIVKHIINIHNGKISLESREEEGTTFTVKLPAHY